ncbi:SpaA isopeptide-forming pilin-related protein [Ruminococcus sp.]
MNKFKKLKSAIISFCKPKKLTSLAVALTTIFAMLPIASVSAGAYSYTGLDEIGGKVLIESSEKPIVLVNNGSDGRLDAYKFKFNGEIGYCIDPQSFAQTTDGQTVEFTDFYGDTGKEVIKLDPNSSNASEKALIVGEELLYAKRFFDSKEIVVENKTMKQYMYDKFIGPKAAYKYSSFFSAAKISNDDAYYILSHFALSQLYHTMLNDKSTAWKTWSGYSDISEMVNMIVDVCQRVSKHSGNYSKIASYASTTNIYIAHPKPKNPKDGTYQHLIVEIPKKAKLSLQKSGTNDSIKDLTEITQDKDYLNFSGAEYTLYKKADNSVVAVAQLNRNGNISKIKYSYSNQDWIGKSYFELDAGEYYLKETKAPSNGYFALSDKKYNVTVTTDDCNNERILDILQLSDTEIVKLKFKKESSNPDLTTDNDCYSLDGGIFAVFSDEKSAYDYISGNSVKNNIVRYFITDSNGDCKAISKDGNSWDYNANSDLYKIAYSDSYYAVEMSAPKGFKNYNRPVQMAINGTDGGFAVLSATIADEPLNDPIRILVQKKDAVTGQTTNMAGAEFTVKYYSGYYYSESELNGKTPTRKWILKTDSDGYCRLADEYRAESDFGEDFYLRSSGDVTLPLGTFTVQETKAPTGYKINPELFIRQIKVDEATGSITTFNEIEVPEPRDTVYGNLTIYKTADDSKRGANTAKNVWFNVKSDDGVTDENIVTKSDGIDGAATLSDLPVYKASGEYVKYIITELGYKNADGTYSIPDRYIPPAKKTVTLKENVTLSFYFANRLQKTGLIVQKESEDGIISGFYFSVKSDDGKTNKVLVTGADGSAELTNLAVYNTSNKKVKYIVDELGFKNADGTYYFPTKYVKPAAQTVTLEDGKSFVVTMKNLLKRGSVRLTKTDGAGNPLKGIEFELYNTKTGIVNVINKNSSIMYEAADRKTADTVTKLVTDSDGRIIVNNLLPGDYYFLETNSKGNMPYAGKINFTISPDSLDTLDIQLTVKNNSVFIPETGGTGNNRPIYIEIGAAVLAFTVLVGAIGLGIRKKKKHIGKKAQQ